MIAFEKSAREQGVKRAGFILIETMVSSLIASVLLAGLAASVLFAVKITRIIEDINFAHEKSEMVFAILSEAIEHCGYGLPKDAQEYINGFKGTSPPFRWEGPFTIHNSNGKENASCKIAYAVRSYIRTIEETKITDGTFGIRTTEVPSFVGYGGESKENDVKSWLIFGSMIPYCIPLRIAGSPEKYPDGSALLKARVMTPLRHEDEIIIPENDELFELRAMECHVVKSDGEFVFATNDWTGSGLQPRVEGVVDARFELHGEGRLIRVYTLTRGKTKYKGVITRDTPENWPEKYASSIPEEARYYKLFANKASFELKNF
jgi:type II secretory pathway pseudopilin PulG